MKSDTAKQPMARRRILTAAGALAGLSAVSLAHGAPDAAAIPPAAKSGTPPNILVLVVDDLGWGDVGFHGGTLHTPRLDRLAKESLELKRFYVHPVCSPTRAALITGQMPRRFGIANVMGPRQSLPEGLSTFPGTFQAAGYQTSLVGKWHLGAQSPPMQNGFDHFYGFLGAELDYFKHTGLRGGALDWQRDGKPVEEQGYSTTLFADEAIRTIEKRDAKHPFFLEVAFNAPHFPLSAPDEYLAKYKNLSGQQATYAAVVDALDTSVGRILDALDKQGLRENTIVLFFSDNGAGQCGSNAPLRGGKDTIFEGGIHTPCLLRWPGRLKEGAASQQPIAAQDIYPTLGTAAGVPVKDAAKLDGKSQWDALRGGRVQDRSPFIIVGSSGNDFAIFDGTWKLIETSDGKRSLYQLADDPRETTDLYVRSTDVARRLEATLAGVKKELPAVRTRPSPGAGAGSGRPGGRAGGRPGAKPSATTKQEGTAP